MAESEMFSISLSVDGRIKLANSLQLIDATHTFYEAIEECLAQNHMVGLFEIDPQHMKFTSVNQLLLNNSVRVFVNPEDPLTSNELTEKLLNPHLCSVHISS